MEFQRMKRVTVFLTALVVGIFAMFIAEPKAGEAEVWKTLPATKQMPAATATGNARVNGVEIYFTIHGSGEPLILLHGGLGSTEDWGGQVAGFSAKYKVISIASRGHGRSTRDDQAYTFHLMASDVLAVMDILSIEKASIVGFSDGANIGIDIAINNPDRLDKLFAFGANFDPSGALPTVHTDSVFGAYVGRVAADYGRLSSTPDQFSDFLAQISQMWAVEPSFTEDQLKAIQAPIAIAEGEFSEVISLEHTKQLAAFIPGSTLILLPNLSHFAMWQGPESFNAAVLEFLEMD
jgi:pimeloyl-ACP methyl ester carboxylesterase